MCAHVSELSAVDMPAAWQELRAAILRHDLSAPDLARLTAFTPGSPAPTPPSCDGDLLCTTHSSGITCSRCDFGCREGVTPSEAAACNNPAP